MTVSPFLPLGFSPGCHGVPRRSPSVFTLRKRNGDGDDGRKQPKKSRAGARPRRSSKVRFWMKSLSICFHGHTLPVQASFNRNIGNIFIFVPEASFTPYRRSQIPYDPLDDANGALKHDASLKSSRSGFRRLFPRRWLATAPRSGSARRPCRSGKSLGTGHSG